MAPRHDQAALPPLTAPGQDRTTGPAVAATHDRDHDGAHAFEWPEAMRIAGVTLIAVAVWFRLGEPYPGISLIGVRRVSNGQSCRITADLV